MGGGNKGAQKAYKTMHPVQIVAKCKFANEISFGIGGLGLFTRIGVLLISLIQMSICCKVSTLMN